MNSQFTPYIKRLLITFGLSFVFVVAFTEISHFFQRDDSDRAPETITIVIPEGTAERIEAGDPGPQLPQGMVFVVGDVLEVINQDVVDHQLGPIWVPPGAAGNLTLEYAEKYSYSCSFAPSRYLGLDVREPTTLATRITALSISVPTTTAFVFIYSLAAVPVKSPAKKKSEPAGEEKGQSG